MLIDSGGWICDPEYGGPDSAAFIYDLTTAVLTRTSVPSGYGPGDVSPLQDGRVLGTGIFRGPVGWEDEPSGYAIWSPKTTRWSAVENTGAEHAGSTVTLADGRVLLAGGSSGQDLTNMVQIFDPARDAWRETGSMPVTFDDLEIVALADGSALAVGSDYDDGSPAAAIYDGASGLWSEAPALPGGDPKISLVALTDGSALAFGASGTITRFAQTTGWREAGQLLWPRQKPAVAVLGNGMVMAAGGAAGDGGSVAVELYDPSAMALTLVAELPSPRRGGSLIPLQDGSVLLVGGYRSERIDDGTLECVEAGDRALRWTPAR